MSLHVQYGTVGTECRYLRVGNVLIGTVGR